MTWYLNHWSAFGKYVQDWDTVCERDYSGHPFLDSTFVSGSLEHFADDNVYVAAEMVSGVAKTLAIVRKKQWGVWESFAPSQLPFSLLVSSSQQPTATVARQLLAALPGPVLQLGVKHLDERYMGVFDETSFADRVDYGRTMSIRCDGSFTDYWEARSRKLKTNMRRYEKKLREKNLAGRLEVQAKASEADEAVKIYGDIESAGWKGQQGSAIHSSNLQGRFYSGLLKDFSGRNDIRIYHFYANNKVIASRLAVLKNGIMVFLKTTYDESYREFAPGRLLLKAVLEHAFEDRAIKDIEFYTKATKDQLQWAGSDRSIAHHNVYSSRAVKFLANNLRRRPNAN